MASIINKRQQARNERTLQDLIKNVPGNDRCADCFARNPGWASWSLGIFLCLRCASTHRKLGTHVSKVKSLSMDTWNLEQVENMKKTGNIASNRQYNPRSVKPNIPIDADEVDSVMERFIRDKYQHRAYTNDPSSRHNTGSSSNSAEDIPPPLPPKNGPPRFGAALRSSSSQYPQSRQLPSPPASDATNSSNASRDAIRLSRIPETEAPMTHDSKLAQLRAMGFTNESRNNTVLKALNGNVERAVEALVRLREGDVEYQKKGGGGAPNGISFESASSTPQRAQNTGMANGVSVSTHSTGSLGNRLNSSNPWNPFMNMTQQPTQNPQPLDQSFQNMSLTEPNTPQQQQQQQQSNNNPFLRTFTPPISPSSYFQANPNPPLQPQQTGYPAFQPQTPSFVSSNPFAQSMYQQPQQSQQQNHMPPVPAMPAWAQEQQDPVQANGIQSHNPFFQQPQQAQSQPQTPYAAPEPQQQASYNSYYQQPQQQQQPQIQQQQFQASAALSAQPTGANNNNIFRDKSSIMALYGSPAPSNPYQNFQNHQQQQGEGPGESQFQAPQRSVTMPVLSANGPQTMQPPHQPSHVSRESMAFGGGGMRSGSPDAFSGLSARWR